MDERLHLDGRAPGGEALVMPPWPHEQVVEPLPHAANWFRERHGMAGKFVVMYSGNHSPANPLDTLLEAARRLRDDERIRFAFVGGGMSKPALDAFVAEHHLHNVISLPYQPLADLRYSLSAADVHVVSLGEGMVGIIHPCKVYGAMAVGRPVLFLGPSPSHVSDLLASHRIGWHVSHGDVEGCVSTIRQARDDAAAAEGGTELTEMGGRAQNALREGLSRDVLCARMADAVERVMASSRGPSS
jgi:glycosyltransferase involved in cell wall biosynthesis